MRVGGGEWREGEGQGWAAEAAGRGARVGAAPTRTDAGLPSHKGPSPDMTASTSSMFTSVTPTPSIKPTARGVRISRLRSTMVPPTEYAMQHKTVQMAKKP